MSQTITKHIGEGFGKGEAYAALAYDSGDSFGGMQIKGIKLSPESGNRAIQIGDDSTDESYTAGTPLVSMYFTSSNTGSTNAEPIYIKSTMTGEDGYGGRCRFHAYKNVTGGTNFMALKAQAEFGDSGRISGLAAAFCAELVMPNENTGSGGAYSVLELEYVAGGNSLVTAGGLSGNYATFIYMNNTGDADGDFDDNGFLFVLKGLTSGSDHLFYDDTDAPFDAFLRVGVNDDTYYIGLMDTAAAAT